MMLVTVPLYGAYMLLLSGIVIFCSNIIYVRLLPLRPLRIRIEEAVFHFQLGWSFFLVLTTGVLCALVGSLISFVDLKYSHAFSAPKELDYGNSNLIFIFGHNIENHRCFILLYFLPFHFLFQALHSKDL